MFRIIMSVLAVLIFVSVASADFAIVNGSHPKVTHGRLQKVMIDYNNAGEAVSGDIQYHEGYLKDASFISLGVNHIHLVDKEFIKVYSGFLTAKDRTIYLENWLITKTGGSQ